MRSFYEIYLTAGGGILMFFAVMLLIGQLYVLLQAMRVRRSHIFNVLCVLHMVFLMVFCMLLFEGVQVKTKFNDAYEDLSMPVRALYSQPWITVAALEILSALMSFRLLGNRRYLENHLTADSIKETVDLLPVGICIGSENGTVLLANVTMNALAVALTDRPLLDMISFREEIIRQGKARGEEILVRIPDKGVWLFGESRITAGGNPYIQFSALDMTKEYLLTDELTADNRRLKDVQLRINTIIAREAGLRIQREIMKARSMVHDQMGSVLLTGKYYLDHLDSASGADLLRLLEYNNYFLLGEAEQPDDAGDPVEDAMHIAKNIGITVNIEGGITRREPARSIIADALEQCAVNAVRHAGAGCLYAAFAESAENVSVIFTNNGDKPTTAVHETGGLAMLRKKVEAAGGKMTVESDPVFSLTLTIPS